MGHHGKAPCTCSVYVFRLHKNEHTCSDLILSGIRIITTLVPYTQEQRLLFKGQT